MDSLIELQQVRKSYQMGEVLVHALADINLTINRGEYVAILGPSGSGKSTLMNLLGCLDRPTEGVYRLSGVDVSQMSRNALAGVRNRQIGFVFQSFNLLDFCNAQDNVALPLVYRGIATEERAQLAQAMLSKVGLAGRYTHKPNELSGGQRQRVAIARALVTEPDMVLADEPTGNLDSHSGDAIITMFEQLAAEGKTVIIVTHDPQLAQRAGRMITIKDGRVSSDV